MAKIKPEFDKRNVKVIGISVDPIDSHAKWSKDIEETQGIAPELSDDRRSRAQDFEALRNAPGRRR